MSLLSWSRRLVATLVFASLAACGSGGGTGADDGPDATAQRSTASAAGTASEKPRRLRTNVAPTISGTPPGKVAIGQSYDFQPSASDSNGDPLVFAIVNKPAWATFSTATGRLTGTPGLAHVGTQEGIAISVSDGKVSTALPAFAVSVESTRKSNYGHYFATRGADTPSDAAMLCEQSGVRGVVWRVAWRRSAHSCSCACSPR